MADLADPGADLRMETPVTADHAAESSTVFRWVPSIWMMGRWTSEAGAS